MFRKPGRVVDVRYYCSNKRPKITIPAKLCHFDYLWGGTNAGEQRGASDSRLFCRAKNTLTGRSEKNLIGRLRFPDRLVLIAT